MTPDELTRDAAFKDFVLDHGIIGTLETVASMARIMRIVMEHEQKDGVEIKYKLYMAEVGIIELLERLKKI